MVSVRLKPALGLKNSQGGRTSQVDSHTNYNRYRSTCSRPPMAKRRGERSRQDPAKGKFGSGLAVCCIGAVLLAVVLALWLPLGEQLDTSSQPVSRAAERKSQGLDAAVAQSKKELNRIQNKHDQLKTDLEAAKLEYDAAKKAAETIEAEAQRAEAEAARAKSLAESGKSNHAQGPKGDEASKPES